MHIHIYIYILYMLRLWIRNSVWLEHLSCHGAKCNSYLKQDQEKSRPNTYPRHEIFQMWDYNWSFIADDSEKQVMSTHMIPSLHWSCMITLGNWLT